MTERVVESLRGTLRAVLTNVRAARETIGDAALAGREQLAAHCLDNAEWAIAQALDLSNPRPTSSTSAET